MFFLFCKRVTLLLYISIFSFLTTNAVSNKQGEEYYQIKVYHFTTSEQEAVLDNYFKTAYLPALHKAGIKNVGVFKPLANDTAADKRVYVFIASPSSQKLLDLVQTLKSDATYNTAAKEYLDAAFNNAPFTRFEIILLKAFPLAQQMELPALKNEKKERVYELRSYESPTEKLYNSKVKMFNEGGEISLFKRLNFNAVFYAEVLSGSRMPNLMYMTTFENMQERDAHWKAFFADPDWKQLSALPEYQHNVSKADIIFLRPSDYSDF